MATLSACAQLHSQIYAAVLWATRAKVSIVHAQAKPRKHTHTHKHIYTRAHNNLAESEFKGSTSRPAE